MSGYGIYTIKRPSDINEKSINNLIVIIPSIFHSKRDLYKMGKMEIYRNNGKSVTASKKNLFNLVLEYERRNVVSTPDRPGIKLLCIIVYYLVYELSLSYDIDMYKSVEHYIAELINSFQYRPDIINPYLVRIYKEHDIGRKLITDILMNTKYRYSIRNYIVDNVISPGDPEEAKIIRQTYKI